MDAILHHPADPRRSASSVPPTSPTTSIRPGTANGKARPGHGRRQEPRHHSCPTPTYDQAIKDIMGAAYGSAGERCMALPVVVPVGAKAAKRGARKASWPRSRRSSVGVSSDPSAQYGPVVSAAHKKKIEDYIQLGKSTRAPNWSSMAAASRPAGLREGLLHRPERCSITSSLTMKSPIKEEIFGPVLQIVRADSFEEAVSYADQAPVRQRRRHLHPRWPRRARVRQPASMSAWSASMCRSPSRSPITPSAAGSVAAFGDTNQHGMEGVKFYTKVKTDHGALAGRHAGRLGLRHSDAGLGQ